MQKLKRIRELTVYFFHSIRERGLSDTMKRLFGFIKRRTRQRRGRFLPRRQELDRQRAADTTGWPKVSVCTALFNTDPGYLRGFLNSFLAQTYANCELCLADASDDRHGYVREIVEGVHCSRILYTRLKDNLGISANTNAAAALAGGSILALADHDDILSPDACFEIAQAAHGGAQFIYSDEALFGWDYRDPITGHFKPDYSPYYLTNCNYICHLSAFSADLFREVGGLDSRYDGSQDHDLIFKLTERTDRIIHIQKVLYYWRVHSGSTSAGVAAKPYVEKAAIDAIDAHLRRCGIEGKAVRGLFPSTYKVNYRIIGEPLVSILIPNKNHVADLSACLESIYSNTTWKRFEIVVLENNSSEPQTFTYYDTIRKSHTDLRVETFGGEFNFSSVMNFGSEKALGDYLVLLNNDIKIISKDWIEQMLMLAEQPGTGAVGAMLYYPDDTVQHAGVITGLGGCAGHSHKHADRGRSGYMFRLAVVQDFSAVTAALMMVPKKAYSAVGGFDPRFVVAFNDVDFCLRLRRAGYHVLFTPYAEAYHCESKSRGLDTKGPAKERFDREQALLKERYGEALLHDPFYNPNLTLDMENFEESRVLPNLQ